MAHKLERDVEHYEDHTHEDRRIAFQTYGTSGLGLDLTADAWPSLTQVFSAGSHVAVTSCPGRPPCPLLPALAPPPRPALSSPPPALLLPPAPT